MPPQLFVYEYYQKAVWDNLPWPLIHNIRQEIPFYKGMGFDGFYTQSSDFSIPSYQLNIYLATKLTWDTGANVDEILEDYFRKMYGPVSNIMQFYYETYEDAFASSPEHIGPLHLDPTPVAFYKVFSAELIEQATIILSKAFIENTDPLVHDRLIRVRIMQEYTGKIRSYLDAITIPFVWIDFDDPRSVRLAHKRARKIGEAYSRNILDFLLQDHAEVYLPGARNLLKAH